MGLNGRRDGDVKIGRLNFIPSCWSQYCVELIFRFL